MPAVASCDVRCVTITAALMSVVAYINSRRELIALPLPIYFINRICLAKAVLKQLQTLQSDGDVYLKHCSSRNQQSWSCNFEMWQATAFPLTFEMQPAALCISPCLRCGDMLSLPHAKEKPHYNKWYFVQSRLNKDPNTS